MPNVKRVNAQSITEAVNLLRAGRLVAFPTETVYGLGADARCGEAVARIYEAKGRPSFNPLISHYKDSVAAFADVQANEWARELATYFWPGPLTMILPKAESGTISSLATAGLDTAAVRVPAHDVARQLLTAFDGPIVAPSANVSGEVSPTAPIHVAESLGDKVDLILAGGACQIGLESTVIDLSGKLPLILRPGHVLKEDIEDRLGCEIGLDFGPKEKTDKPKSPGQILKHYAPSLPVRLRAVDVAPNEALLSFGSTKFMAIKGGGVAADLPMVQHISLSPTGDLHEAAANLFAGLRRLDDPKFKAIAVMDIPNQGLGVAINERLSRAAAAKT